MAMHSYYNMISGFMLKVLLCMLLHVMGTL